MPIVAEQITIPDEFRDDAIDAMCDWGDYETNKNDGETRAQFALRVPRMITKQKIISHIRKGRRSAVNADYDAQIAAADAATDTDDVSMGELS
jgi:hypothetical protein